MAVSTTPVAECQAHAGADRYVLTRHALERSHEMGLDRRHIIGAIENPQTDYPSLDRRHHQARRIATRDELAVVYAPADRLVITVLWNGRDGR